MASSSTTSPTVASSATTSTTTPASSSTSACAAAAHHGQHGRAAGLDRPEDPGLRGDRLGQRPERRAEVDRDQQDLHYYPYYPEPHRLRPDRRVFHPGHLRPAHLDPAHLHPAHLDREPTSTPRTSTSGTGTIGSSATSVNTNTPEQLAGDEATIDNDKATLVNAQQALAAAIWSAR